jgi:hypothetical protein
MKETFYFSHDYNARGDEKIIKLIQKHGWEAYGLFWAIVEKLYENNGFIDNDCERIAFDLRTDCERIKNVIESDLFEIRNEKIYSKSVNARLIKRKGKSEMARQSAFFRWNKPKKTDANAMRTQCERNAIKESKVKESKVNIVEASSTEIPDLLKDKNKHIQIIGVYAKAKKVVFENKEIQSSFIKRNLRASKDLVGYEFQKIVDTMKYLLEKADFKWTLESVGKFIDENLNNINNKPMTEEERINAISREIDKKYGLAK